MTNSSSFFDILLLAISVYVLIAGIRGKGRLFQVENVKKGMEEKLKSTSRKIYISLGVAMLINCASSLTSGLFYSYEEVTAATDTEDAVYQWVQTRDLGSFSFMTREVFSIISWVALAITMGLIVLLVVLLRKYVDKDAQKRASASGARQADPRQQGHTLPVSAFEFDEPEQTADRKK